VDRSFIPGADEVPPIPGYELVDWIGAGSMGVVFRARQLQPSRIVAIKYLLRLPTDHSAILSRRYQRESQLMASLSHPNVVAMYDCGKLLGQFYLIMEYVAGSTLRTRMKPGEPWSTSQAALVVNAVYSMMR
jgi:serine/threonine-protein kinase